MIKKLLIMLPIIVLAMQQKADEDSIRFIFEPDSLLLHVGESAEITIKMVTSNGKLSGTPFLIYGQPRRSLETYPRISDSTGFAKVKVKPYKPGSLKLRTRSISIKREDRTYGELKISVPKPKLKKIVFKISNDNIYEGTTIRLEPVVYDEANLIRDDVSVLLEDALSARLIDKEAQFIAERAIRLGDTTVKEIMVPRVEMVILAPDEDPLGMIARIIESGHSRYPVLGPAKNEVQGILLAKDLLPIINKDLEDFDLKNLIRDIKVVPESKKADSLLEEFKKDRSHMAVVIDEYGTISGLVTIEDILEELVGEIEDEHDTDDEDLIQVSEYEYIADATLELTEFENKFNKNFNGMDAETLAGLFINKLGFLPKVGDKIELDDMILAVTAADKRKIKKIGITIKTNT